MSVIAWDGRTIAADCQATTAGMRVRVRKLHLMPNGTVLGWTGDNEMGLALVNWYVSGGDRKAWPEFQKGEDWTRLIVVSPEFHLPFCYERLPERQFVKDAFIAFGSGRDWAMGAMAMGADARKAVEIANQFCTGCGLGVEAYDLVS